MFEEAEFPSGGNMLRGRLYRQEKAGAPFVVMAHGTSATITMVADAYAECMNEAGFNVLLYDHPNFGMSDGEPRYEINPWLQGRGYRDAVNWLRSTQGAKKVAIWGDSYSAMIALVVAALIPDVAAVVAQIPACGIALPELEPSEENFQRLKETFDAGDISGGKEHTTGPLPVVSADQLNAPSLLTPIQAFRWFIEYGGRFGSNWSNQVTRVIPPTPVPFSPYLAAPYIEAPVLMMTARNDEMVHCNPQVQQAVFAGITAPKELYEIDGGHFGLLWHPGKLFDEATTKQTDFLRSVLL